MVEAHTVAWSRSADRPRKVVKRRHRPLHLTRLQRHTGEFIQSIGHDMGGYRYWVTLTYGQLVAAAWVHKMFRIWSRRVAQDLLCGLHFGYVAVIEQEGREAWHLHALLATPEDLDPKTATAKWQGLDSRAGFTKFDRYEAGGGAPFYVASKPEQFIIDVACPRPPACRRPGKGCTEFRALADRRTSPHDFP